ncbi:hypothetical protein J2S49_000351 [Arcanobacterium wilhelmae]|uniref:DUF3046 domain-containing protein n=1 Tax=Arcanobacterium wilhelmae TaxID=1803177 RepID=A0ABT9N9A0_9ACTO|nr:DUF3046 domain-containing protein [Arcanobacterium wilhelmae]MDP9800275.1 hypothetical protein [Arcanobacterium wilhelmae]WFN89713.1 DUF3046 domain-containing protein [Arcanobacterium wilhelmae]
MRYAEFWALFDRVFPDGRGSSLAEDLSLVEFGNLTPRQAAEAGYDLQRVWEGVCDAMDLPPSYYFLHREDPKKHRA